MVYIPGFLIHKVYQKNSLKNLPNGFEFTFMNRMTPVRISGIRDLILDVDGQSYKEENISMTLGGEAIDFTGGEGGRILSFAKESKLVIQVAGEPLSQGKHVMKISFITNEYGGATIKVSDWIGDEEKGSLWGRLKHRLGGGGKSAAREDREAGASPVTVEGELGGVPLDPDFARLEAALNREEADRVPFFEAEIALPIQEYILGREINSARDEIAFYVRAGYDYVPVLPPFFTPRLMRTASDETGELDEGDRERAWITESEGLIKSLADVEAFPWPKAEEVDFSSFHEIAELLPPKMKTIGMLSPAAVFGNSSQAMGLQNFSYALYDNEPLVAALFEIIGATYVEIARRLVQVPRLGAVFMSDDLAHTGGCLVSPKVYRQYVFPWYRRIGDILEGAGLPFIFHSDGKLIEVLDDLSACGITAIHPIEPQAMDIVEVKRKYGDRFCIFGNIDLDYTLPRGTPEEVTALVKKRLKELGPGGGYGLSASNSIPDYVKPENYRAMIEAGKRYGAYPINI